MYNNKIYLYIDYTLFKINKTKIVLKNHSLIITKLFCPTFNYLKFHVIIYLIKYIKNYGNTINNNIIQSKIPYKYLFKVFYKQTNKEKYKSQISQYNIYYINIF